MVRRECWKDFVCVLGLGRRFKVAPRSMFCSRHGICYVDDEAGLYVKSMAGSLRQEWLHDHIYEPFRLKRQRYHSLLRLLLSTHNEYEHSYAKALTPVVCRTCFTIL